MTNLVVGTTSPNTFTINLPKYELKWTFDRDQYLEKFPQSMLAQALEMDPAVTNIDITEPFINPTIVSVMYLLTHAPWTLPKHITRDLWSNTELTASLEQGSRYFLIDELRLFSSPAIVDLLDAHQYDALMSASSAIVEQAVLLQHIPYIEYIWDRLSDEMKEDVLMGSIITENLSLMKKIIQEKKVNPATAKCHDMTFGGKGYKDVQGYIARILDPAHSLTFVTWARAAVGEVCDALYYAQGNPEIMKWLIINTSVQDSSGYHLKKACEQKDLSIVLTLAEHRKYTPEQWTSALHKVFGHDSKMKNMGEMMDSWNKDHDLKSFLECMMHPKDSQIIDNFVGSLQETFAKSLQLDNAEDDEEDDESKELFGENFIKNFKAKYLRDLSTAMYDRTKKLMHETYDHMIGVMQSEPYLSLLSSILRQLEGKEKEDKTEKEE